MGLEGNTHISQAEEINMLHKLGSVLCLINNISAPCHGVGL